MKKVDLLDAFGFVIHQAKIPDSLPRTIIWGEDVYLAGSPGPDGTPRYFLTTTFVCDETPASGVYKLPDFG